MKNISKIIRFLIFNITLSIISVLLILSIKASGQTSISSIRMQGNEDVLKLAIVSVEDAQTAGNGVIKIKLDDGTIGALYLVPPDHFSATEVRIETPYGTMSWGNLTSLTVNYWWPYGGDSADVAYSLIESSTNAFIIAGGTKSYGYGDSDMLILKSAYPDSWSKVYGTTSFDICRAVKLTSDNGYILLGSTNGFGFGEMDFYYKKLNDVGESEWGYSWGTENIDNGYDLILDTDNGYIYVGETNGLGAGGFDVVMIKQNPDNTIGWGYATGTTQDESGYAMVRSSDGGIVVAGIRYNESEANYNMLFDKFDANGVLLYGKEIGGDQFEEARSITLSEDNDYVLAGQTSSFGAGGADYYAKKLDANGNSVWGWAYGFPGNEYAYCIANTIDNGFVIVGESYSLGAGESDIWLIKINDAGQLEWSWIFGGTQRDAGYSVIQNISGNYCIAGGTESFGSGQEDVIFINLSIDGDLTEISSPFINDSIINEKIGNEKFKAAKIDPYDTYSQMDETDMTDVTSNIIQTNLSNIKTIKEED